MPPPARVALLGNPNTGKSTLFNALTGLHQHVGNYPGVTVDHTLGKLTHDGRELTLIDLPGTYSLAPRSPDEMVSVDLLCGRIPGEGPPDLILAIVDAGNLDRHLYLVSQLMEVGLPVVVALNLIDLAEARHIKVDAVGLEKALGVPVVPIQANRKIGLDQLKTRLVQTIGRAAPELKLFPAAVEAEVSTLRQLVPSLNTFLARRAIFDVDGSAELAVEAMRPGVAAEQIIPARQRLAEQKLSVPGVEARTRYGWVRPIASSCASRPAAPVRTGSDKIDGVLTHKIWGTLIFLLMMLGVFQAIFVAAKPMMDLISGGFSSLADVVKTSMEPGPLRALLADGVINGVGSILVFLPQILILFGFIAVLEDCGYMSRAAFLMDRLMARAGLNGKSFIPLLSSTACAVPGVMAARVIDNPRDRLVTMLVAPLMSCSARLPLYLLVVGAFFADPWWLPGVVLFALYMIGFVTAPIVALTLKRTILRGKTPPLLMEMPTFRWPSIRAVIRRALSAGWAFLYRAGTFIFCSMVVIWALLYFPQTAPDGSSYEARSAELETRMEAADDADEKADLQRQSNRLTGEWRANSYLGKLGHWMEPVFEPLGWNWKVGVAAMAAFPAREVIVGTLGMLYEQGDYDPGLAGEDTEETRSFQETIRRDWGPHKNAVGASLLVFFALCMQCASTLAVIGRETRSLKWPLFTFVYMTVLAYVMGVITYRVALMLGG